MNESELSGPHYWKSLDDLAETPAFHEWVEREFPAGASEMEGVNRRQFMKVMAASFGLAGLGMAGCRRPEQTILPYSQQPENLIPGVPVYYTTSMPRAQGNMPVIAETHMGRPTKVEGNPSYKPYNGATDVYTQASILDLYDPDRATKSRKRGAVVSDIAVRDMLAELSATHAVDGGEGLLFLAEPSTSPSRARLAASIKAKLPKATWTEYAPLSYAAPEKAAEKVFGKPLRSMPKFEKAKRVLSIDSDFLHSGPASLQYARGFAKTRRVENSEEATKMNRLYSVESGMTSTGAMGDHRLRLSSSQMGAFTAKIALALGIALPSKAQSAADSLSVDSKWIEECAADLKEYAGKALVIAGEHLPESVHALVIAINAELKAPIDYLEVPAAAAGIDVAAARLQEGVKTLVVLGGNPVYDAPADLGFKALMNKADESIHLSYSYNETSAEADTLIAQSHYLESWGDGRTYDGTLVPVQPMIEPLFPAFCELEVLARIADEEVMDPYAIANATFLAEGGVDYNKFLSDGLLPNSGYVKGSNQVNASAVASALVIDELNAFQLSSDSLEVRFEPSSHGYDGRYANNGWMMEAPDSMTKLTWDNAILISPRLAKELQKEQGVQIFPGLSLMSNSESALGGFFEAAKGQQQTNKAQFKRGKEEAVVAELTLDGRTIKAPIHVVPGMANYTIILPLGLGRTEVGRVGKGVGFDAYKLRTSTGMACALGAALKLTKETYRLANTQEHWSMEGRAIVREATAKYYKEHSDFANKMGVESHAPPNYGKDEKKSEAYKALETPRGGSSYEHPDHKGAPPNVNIWKGHEDKFPHTQQWGMAIDMNTCTGCTACVVACQSENNIPIVGKDQVLRGREMHWMRMDRYFSAEKAEPSEIPEDVQVSFMGVSCMHCENAPCESVCPVNATVHDRQGLNTMAYNRCVGTRYCANNCPYKVRRFNFFDWNKRQPGDFYKGPFGKVDEPELEKMRANPNVTVRMRGVMEKCTYCTQRIEAAKIDQKSKAGASADIHVPDGKIKTACQQVCPTDAITFGDVADPNSEVSKMKASDRNYSVLGYLNVRPRTTYLARLRNPNPKMPDTYKKPFAYAQYKARYGSQSKATDKYADPKHDEHGHKDHAHHEDHAH
ncbi:MAG: TAT-variant-translocated molybdopterin oxidoreductase [Verrucomicrobiota bacterium]